VSRTKQQKNPDRNGKEGGAPGKDSTGGANDDGVRSKDSAARTKDDAARSRDERVHNRLAVLRAARGVTRRKLAEELGIHYQTMGYLERGEYAPSLHLALRIARWFGVPVESVFSLDEFPPLI
jgi:conserved domain protein